MTADPRPAALLLEVTDLVTHFRSPRGLVRAVDGVTLSIERGQAVGIVGESGAGKTVLARSIMGLISDADAERRGSVRFRGDELLHRRDRQMRSIWGRSMAMVFQDPMGSLNPLMRVGDQVSEPLRVHLGMGRGEARAAAERLLTDVRIPQPARRMRQFPHELSGGTRQRVMIAIALACGPELLFADEPTTSLDVTVQAQILALLDEQRRTRNMAMVLVTHDLGVVANHTDVTLVMYGGSIVERAPTRTLFSNMKMPYTEALFESIPSLEAAPHSRRSAIPGRPPDLVAPPPGCRFAPRCAYARDRCHAEQPPLVAAEAPDHQYACWYPLRPPDHRTGTASRPDPAAARETR